MKTGLCWLRRDLRLHDHHALSMSLKNCERTYVVFILDEFILNKLPDKSDMRVSFIIESLLEINAVLKEHHSALIVRYGDPLELIPALCRELSVTDLFFNRDYEPYAKKRDSAVIEKLAQEKRSAHTFKDHVVFEKEEIKSGSGDMYKVFTPYKRRWLEQFSSQEKVIQTFHCALKNLAKFKGEQQNYYELAKFQKADLPIAAGTKEGLRKCKQFIHSVTFYDETRDRPDLEGTSQLSVYLRHGNVSIRDLLKVALQGNTTGHSTFLSELIWRDFYQALLDQYPQLEHHSFKSEYEKIKWQGNPEHFRAWCEGQTGFPLVDAAMRCLNATGFMHNRLRMVTANFLTKILLIDYRWGEKYFAEKLLDYDLAANNGGWQWSAGTGADAQPYFRIFNPYTQSEKFDPEGSFIRMWCPELREFSEKLIHYPQDATPQEQMQAQCLIGVDYPEPIVSYKMQREKALHMYKSTSV